MAHIPMTRDEMLKAQTEALAQYENVDENGKTSPGKHWWLIRRELGREQVLYLYPCGSGVGLGLSHASDDVGYHTVYDFFDLPWLGWVAALCWDGEGEEPFGWNRAHKAGHHTRRRIGGFGEEYVDPHDLKSAPFLPLWGPGQR